MCAAAAPPPTSIITFQLNGRVLVCGKLHQHQCLSNSSLPIFKSGLQGWCFRKGLRVQRPHLITSGHCIVPRKASKVVGTWPAGTKGCWGLSLLWRCAAQDFCRIIVPGHEPFDSRVFYMPTLNGQITRRWKSVDAALGVGGERRTISFRFPPPPLLLRPWGQLHVLPEAHTTGTYPPGP